MMKLSKTIPAAFLISFLFYGNGYSQCENSAIEYIAANKVKAAVPTGGDFFWDRSNAHFVVPYVPGVSENISTIFAGALWLGGIDVDGNLKLAAVTYGNYFGSPDFWPGPIDDETFATFENGCENFNRVWKINRGDILQVKEDFEDNNMIDLPIPISIQTWPAKGNPFFEGIMGFALPDQELAPFFDRNNNGIFEPLNGDYPILDPSTPDAIPDEMTWTVFNDIEDIHMETEGEPIGAEIHFMVYAFNCSENEVLNHTVFTRHKIINKSQIDLFDFKMGVFVEFDLGCPIDDYFGCDTTLNTYYSYNSDNDDQNNQCTGDTYGINPPVQAVTFLNHSLSNFIYYENSEPSPYTHYPVYAEDYYGYMNSIWHNGNHLTYEGGGYNPLGQLTNYAFPGNPNDPNGWAMTNVDLPYDDRKTISSAGPFNFPSGGQLVLDAAFSYHREAGASHLENVDVALANIPAVQDFYDNGFTNACTQFDFCDVDCVWPGDANRDGIAKNDDLLYLGIAMGNSAAGLPRAVVSGQWAPQFADNWNIILPGGTDYKNADFNGDGALNDLDWSVLDFNYRNHLPNYIPSETMAPFAEGQIYCDIIQDEITSLGSTFSNRARLDFFVGSEDKPIQELYGVAFTLKYDTTIWKPHLLGLAYNDNATFFINSGEVFKIVKTMPAEGRVDIAYSRKDGIPLTDAWGGIGRISLSLREDAVTGNPNGMQEFSFQFYDAVGVDGQGNFFPLGAASDVILAKDMIVDTSLVSSVREFNKGVPFDILPNPNSGTFDLFFEKTNTASQISLYDRNGNNIWTETVPANTERHSIDLSGQLPTGVYLVKWTLADGQFATGKVVVK